MKKTFTKVVKAVSKARPQIAVVHFEQPETFNTFVITPTRLR